VALRLVQIAPTGLSLGARPRHDGRARLATATDRAAEPEPDQRHVARSAIHKGLQVGISMMSTCFAPDRSLRTRAWSIVLGVGRGPAAGPHQASKAEGAGAGLSFGLGRRAIRSASFGFCELWSRNGQNDPAYSR
jgi:hypothetical protein